MEAPNFHEKVASPGERHALELRGRGGGGPGGAPPPCRKENQGKSLGERGQPPPPLKRFPASGGSNARPPEPPAAQTIFRPPLVLRGHLLDIPENLVWELFFFSHGKKLSAPSAHAIYCVRVAPCVLHMPCAPCAPWLEYDLCAVAAEFRKTRRVHDLRGRRKDKGTKQRKTDVSDAEVPSDPESVDDEALSDNLSDVSHS